VSTAGEYIQAANPETVKNPSNGAFLWGYPQIIHVKIGCSNMFHSKPSIFHRNPPKFPGIFRESPVITALPARAAAFSSQRCGKTMGFPGISSWSFPAATTDPVKVKDPMAIPILGKNAGKIWQNAGIPILGFLLLV